MKCPHCGADNSKVVETRADDGQVFRRRKCLATGCERSFISREFSHCELKMPAAINAKSAERSRARRALKAAAAARPPVILNWRQPHAQE